MKKTSKQSRRSLRDDYERAWDFYSEQLRRYCAAHPDWRTMPAEKGAKIFWGNFGNW